ncbi:MAG: hypothetical protein J7K87_00570 [Candidatus Aenigmarchaeota archaeon]|nr:hypothetical protein [Candidatus Aenigmarchaeota archaeon]
MLFKSLFSRKKEVETVKVRIEEVETFVKKENEYFLNELEDKIREKYKDIEEKLGEFESSFETFENLKVPEETFERLKKSAETAKKIVESNIEKFIDSFSIPEEATFTQAKKFRQAASEKIADLGNKVGRSLGILRMAMGDELKPLTRSVGNLEKSVIELHKLLKENENKVNDIEEAISLGKSIVSKKKKLQDVIKRIQDKEELLGSKESAMKKLKKDIEDFEKSKDLLLFKEMERKMKDLELKKRETENKIVQEISYFEKAFKKIGYYGTSKDLAIIKILLDSPLNIIPEGSEKLKKILPVVIKQTQNLNLPDKIKKKVLKGAERINSGILDNLLEEHKRLTSEIENLSKKIKTSSVIKKKKSLEDEYKKFPEEISSIRKSIEELKDEKEYLLDEIEFERGSLKNKLDKLSGENVIVIE